MRRKKSCQNPFSAILRLKAWPLVDELFFCDFPKEKRGRATYIDKEHQKRNKRSINGNYNRNIEPARNKEK